MSPWLSEIVRRPVRSLVPAALVALAPKCVVCGLAYAGIGAALGFGAPKICGSTASSWGAWGSSPALFGIALGIAGLLAFVRGRRYGADSGTCARGIARQGSPRPVPLLGRGKPNDFEAEGRLD